MGCLTPIPAGTRVHLAGEDPTDLAGPEVLIGTVVEPTDQERTAGPDEPSEVELLPGCEPTPDLTAMVLVAWPWHRRWEFREDLALIQES